MTTKSYNHYKECRKLYYIETVIGIITDDIGEDDWKAKEVLSYLMDLRNDIEKGIWLETEYQK